MGDGNQKNQTKRKEDDMKFKIQITQSKTDAYERSSRFAQVPATIFSWPDHPETQTEPVVADLGRGTAAGSADERPQERTSTNSTITNNQQKNFVVSLDEGGVL